MICKPYEVWNFTVCGCVQKPQCPKKDCLTGVSTIDSCVCEKMCTKDLCWDGSARDPFDNCSCPQCMMMPMCVVDSVFNSDTCSCEPSKTCSSELCWDGTAPSL